MLATPTGNRMARKDIPNDVAVDILVRLPVKSLVRFRSLSKFYNAAITNPNFISKHFRYSSENRLHLLTFHQKEYSPEPPFINLFSHEMLQIPGIRLLPPERIRALFFLGPPSPVMSEPYTDSELPNLESSPLDGLEESIPKISEALTYLELPVPEMSLASIELGLPVPSWSHIPMDLELPFRDKNVSSLVAYGPCNGIFCLYGTYFHRLSQLLFWNPATREVKVLPLPHHPPTEIEICRHGFGIDPQTNDYKVISLTYEKRPSASVRPIEMNYVEVYSLGTNSWKVLNDNVSARGMCGPTFSSYLNGKYHWLSITPVERAILCFDMTNEEFLKLKLPAVVERSVGESFRYSNVAVLNGVLAYVKEYSCRHGFSSRIEIWVMNEYGVEETWTQKFNIGPHPEVLIFRGFWKDDEILLAEWGYGPLFSYNLNTQRSVQEFPVLGGPRLFQAFKYVESMFTLSVLAVE